jgi:fatty-acid desaturase
MVKPHRDFGLNGGQQAGDAPPAGWLITLLRWFDNEAGVLPDDESHRQVDWLRTIPFIAMHLACLAVFWVGVSPVAVAVALGLYLLRMFAITGFYHRYFSHKAFRTSRPVQFLFALVGAAAVQRGPLWWASHHRHHHVHSDDPEDVHSPRQQGFLWSHMCWFHATFTVNSLTHVWGRRRYATRDDSRNNAFLALITLGEGWHNNHHHYPASARQGFYWWELDATYLVLRLMALLHIVWDLKPLPAAFRDTRRIVTVPAAAEGESAR